MINIEGTSLQGYISTTRAILTAALGDPQQYAEGDKVTCEWAIQDGETIATVYDWKRYELGTPALDEYMEYNIGGNSREACVLIRARIGKVAS